MRSVVSLFALATAAVADLSGQAPGAVHHFHDLADGVFVAEPLYGGGNSTVIVNGDYVVVVDAQGTEAAARALISEIRRRTDAPVRYLVNTHWHGDHHGGNAAFKRAFPTVTILAGSGAREDIRIRSNAEIREVAPFLRELMRPAENHLAEGIRDGRSLTNTQLQELETFVSEEVEFLNNVPPGFRYTEPDTELDAAVELTDGGRRVVIMPTGPAHTRGDVVVLLPDDGILVAGDILTVPYVVPRSGFPKRYSRVLDELLAEAPSVIVPGHGPPADHGELAGTMADFLTTVVEHSERARAQGHDAEAAVQSALADTRIATFEERIQWDAPGGLTFLSFADLVAMTVRRAYAEADLPTG